MPEFKHLEGTPPTMPNYDVIDVLELLQARIRRVGRLLDEMDEPKVSNQVLTLNDEIDEILRSVKGQSRMTSDDEVVDFERWKAEIMTGQEMASERSDIRRGLSFD